MTVATMIDLGLSESQAVALYDHLSATIDPSVPELLGTLRELAYQIDLRQGNPPRCMSAESFAEQLSNEHPTMTTDPDHAAFWGVTPHQSRKRWVRRLARVFPIYVEHELVDGSLVFERVL